MCQLCLNNLNPINTNSKLQVKFGILILHSHTYNSNPHRCDKLRIYSKHKSFRIHFGYKTLTCYHKHRCYQRNLSILLFWFFHTFVWSILWIKTLRILSANNTFIRWTIRSCWSCWWAIRMKLTLYTSWINAVFIICSRTWWWAISTDASLYIRALTKKINNYCKLTGVWVDWTMSAICALNAYSLETFREIWIFIRTIDILYTFFTSVIVIRAILCWCRTFLTKSATLANIINT